jgi:hypothetical protein
VNSYNKTYTSDALGATIYIDNVPQSSKTTNTSFYPISPGTHYVKVSKSGFFDVSSSQILDSGGKNTYNFLLEPVGKNLPPFAKLIITSTPTAAEVIITDSEGYQNYLLSTTVEKDLAPGIYSVTVKAPCYETQTQSVEIVQGLIYTMPFTLTPSGICYNFEGFDNPVNMSIINTATAGKAIPLKWHLTDTAGNDVNDPQSFHSVQSYQVVCPGDSNGVVNQNIETYTGSSDLRNQGSGNWIFDWATSKKYRGTCRNAFILFSTNQKSLEATFIFI